MAAGAWNAIVHGGAERHALCVFPDRKRLVVEQDGTAIVYDTGAYRLTGFSQTHGPGQTLTFSGPEGRVTLDQLTAVG